MPCDQVVPQSSCFFTAGSENAPFGCRAWMPRDFYRAIAHVNSLSNTRSLVKRPLAVARLSARWRMPGAPSARKVGRRTRRGHRVLAGGVVTTIRLASDPLCAIAAYNEEIGHVGDDAPQRSHGHEASAPDAPLPGSGGTGSARREPRPGHDLQTPTDANRCHAPAESRTGAVA